MDRFGDRPPTDRERWRQVKSLFGEAIDLSGDDREAFLEALDQTHPSVAEELRELIAAFEEDSEFLETGVDGGGSLFGPKTRIGPYRIIRELGRGGMGLVFLADRADREFTQRVAIKVARADVSSAYLLKRFTVEREILGRLSHPNIAQLYGGGVTEDGWPYLVMELVDGTPITDYCRQQGLRVKERLALLQTVCGAVQYAHRNLVVHRDLKPSNILVTEDGHVKLLDFGVAKLLEAAEAEGAGDTRTEIAVTPDYAAPERFAGTPATTLADVYSLGVLGYELLTGARPFDLHGRSIPEMQAILAETTPVPPSRATDETQADQPRLSLNSDLDNVILMCLRHEADRRYPSALALGEDIQRCVEGRPVLARAPTLRYRASRFVRRNRAGVAAAAVVGLAITAGVAGVAWQARVALSRADEAATERDRARASEARIQRVNDFLQDILLTANPSWWVESEAKGPSVTVLEALSEAARRMEFDLADDPEIRGDIHHTLLETFVALRDNEAAQQHADAAIKIRRSLYDEPNIKTAETLFFAATVASRAGRAAEAAELAEEAVRIGTAAGGGGAMPFILEGLGGAHNSAGEFAQAAEVLRQAELAWAEVDGLNPRSVTLFRLHRVGSLVLSGRLDAARDLLSEVSLDDGFALDVESFDEDETAVRAAYYRTLAKVHAAHADFGAARSAWELAGESQEQRESHPERLQVVELISMGEGDLDEAERLVRRFLNAKDPSEREVWEVAEAGRAHGILAYVEAQRGDLAAAQEHLDEARHRFVVGGLETQPRYLWNQTAMWTLARARILGLRGEFDEAERLLTERLSGIRERGGVGFALEQAQAERANLYRLWGRDDLPSPDAVPIDG